MPPLDTTKYRWVLWMGTGDLADAEIADNGRSHWCRRDEPPARSVSGRHMYAIGKNCLKFIFWGYKHPLFTFSTIRSIEKVLHWSKKFISRFWWFSTFWGTLIPKNSFLACCLSVGLSVCVSVCGHHNSKNDWASSTKFGMRSYMIKISVSIAYEQNRPMGVASALWHNSVFGRKVP